jgi:alkanesulfonate monooxygenase SsuD/methylene tetrahydromethanopterin reductase-like flavin-dependent oxidoreductase (luciferase family)
VAHEWHTIGLGAVRDQRSDGSADGGAGGEGQACRGQWLDLLRHHAPGEIPEELRAYVEERTAYDYREHTRRETDHARYVPDEIVDRFTVLGTAAECADKLRRLEALGVTEFNLYTTFENPERVIEIYGREIVPAASCVPA